jgi:hypothetical protein
MTGNSLTPQLMLNLDHHADRGGRIDVSFLHRSFCMAGLPLRNPKSAHFSRSDETFSLNINGRILTLPGGRTLTIPVPSGAKGRLLMVWMGTEAQKGGRVNGDRWLEIGRIKPWLQSIGIRPYGESLAVTKDQLVRLTFSDFTFILKDNNRHLFKGDRLIDSAAFDDQDLGYYADGEFEKVRWPLGIRLTDAAYKRFRENAIAIPTSRLAAIANSAMAIDIFLFLCYRLPQIPFGESELVTWRQLIAQFGSGKESVSKFRETFTVSIQAALKAYPEANIHFEPNKPACEGLVLRYSDPAELRKAFIVSKLPEQMEPRRRKLRNRIPAQKDNFIGDGE